MVINLGVPSFRIFYGIYKYMKRNKNTPCSANARLQLLLENSKSKKGHNYVKKSLRVTCPTGIGSPFDSKQLV